MRGVGNFMQPVNEIVQSLLVIEQNLQSLEGRCHQRENNINVIQRFTKGFGQLTEEKINNYLSAIFFSNLFEQFWATYNFLEDDSDENLRAAFDTIIHDLGDEKLTEMSGVIKDSVEVHDTNDAIQDVQITSCQHELGCIGSTNLKNPKYAFLRNLTVMQKDHVWPKSRTPHRFNPEEIATEGMYLCRYHNQEKRASMASYLALLMSE